MKAATGALAAAVMAWALGTADAAVAATSVGTAAFTITYADGPMPDRWAISLASSGPSATAISLDTLNEDLGPFFPAYDFSGNGSDNGNYHASTLHVDVRDGYRITNLSLAGIAFGDLQPGMLNGVEGVARNEASLIWTIGTGADYYVGPIVRYVDFTGDRAFASGTGTLPFGRSFDVTLIGAVQGYAEAAWDDTRYETSSALGAFRNVVLYVDVAPVPEPATYGMLLGGGAFLLGAARRRSAIPRRSDNG